MDGSSLSVQLWDENQPTADAFDENCVSMTYDTGFWRSINCGQEHMSICKRGGSAPANTTMAPTVPPVGGCPIRWTKFDSKCYSINSRSINWEEARKHCLTIGGNLVSIPTRRVQAFLITTMVTVGSADLWIGLNSKRQEGFYWTDGKPRRYTNWGYSKYLRRHGFFNQHRQEENCVLMNNNPSIGTGKWFIKSCNNSNGFVCHRNLDPNSPSRPEQVVPSIYVALGNDSIKAVTQNLTWDDAQRRCEGEKANLVNLRNQGTQAYVELLAMNLKAPLWIGVNKQQTGGYFRYVDGWHLNFANWADEEPRRDQPCVYMDLDGKWRTAFCNQTMNSVCIQSTDVAPTESTKFPGVCPELIVDNYKRYSWLPFRGYCYLFIMETLGWSNAASSCVRHGGVLASIEDSSEQQFLKSYVEIFVDSLSSFWIGLYKTHKGTWRWLDKTILDYTNWAEAEPTSQFGSMGTLDGTWKSGGPSWVYQRPYICKTPKVMPMDQGTKPEPHKGPDPRSRVHTSLVVVLVIAIASSLMAIGFFIYKKSLRLLPTFDNPLYFNRERSQPDVVDTNKLMEKAEEETPEPIIAL